MNYKDKRILFLGTPAIAASVLEQIILNNYNVIGVISQLDKEKDRKGNILFTPTKLIANKYNIPIYQYDKIRYHAEEIRDLKPDLILTIAYGQIISKEILDIPPYSCLNLHGSLLPKYRGAAPLQRAIMNGEKVSGFTLMKMVESMDAGTMYAKNIVEISDTDNFTSFYEKMKKSAFDVFNDNIKDYFEGNIHKEEQVEKSVSLAKKILREDELLNLNLKPIDFKNYVRALSYEPGAYLYLENEKIKIMKAELLTSLEEECFNLNDYQTGEVMEASKRGIFLKLEEGAIKIIELQRPSKKIMNYKDFINGFKDLKGKIFEC